MARTTTANPRAAGGIKARQVDARALEKALRGQVLSPILKDYEQAVKAARGNMGLVLAALDRETAISPSQFRGLTERLTMNHAQGMSQWHAKRFRSQMRWVMQGIDLGELGDDAVRNVMNDYVRNTSRYMRTVPGRYQERVARTMGELSQRRNPPTRGQIQRVMRRNRQVANNNVRRIARDQTIKAVSGLNRVRQQQAGITHYVWGTVGDDRVRPSHRANSGLTFRWDSPPEATGHPGYDAMCRCTAVPVLRPDITRRPREQQSQNAVVQVSRVHREGDRWRVDVLESSGTRIGALRRGRGRGVPWEMDAALRERFGGAGFGFTNLGQLLRALRSTPDRVRVPPPARRIDPSPEPAAVPRRPTFGGKKKGDGPGQWYFTVLGDDGVEIGRFTRSGGSKTWVPDDALQALYGDSITGHKQVNTLKNVIRGAGGRPSTTRTRTERPAASSTRRQEREALSDTVDLLVVRDGLRPQIAEIEKRLGGKRNVKWLLEQETPEPGSNLARLVRLRATLADVDNRLKQVGLLKGNESWEFVQAAGKRQRLRMEARLGIDALPEDQRPAALRAELHKLIAAERGTGKASPSLRGDATLRGKMEDAVSVLPDDWVRDGARFGPVDVQYGAGRGAAGFYRPGWGSGMPRIEIGRKYENSRGVLMHEYLHHIQRAGTGRHLQAMFERMHKVRTKGERTVELYGYRGLKGKKDKYVDQYAGFKSLRESMTVHFEMLLHPGGFGFRERLEELRTKDPDMLDFLIGALMYFRMGP